MFWQWGGNGQWATGNGQAAMGNRQSAMGSGSPTPFLFTFAICPLPFDFSCLWPSAARPLEFGHFEFTTAPNLITALSEGRGYGEAGGEGLFSSITISKSLTHRFAVPPSPASGRGLSSIFISRSDQMSKLHGRALLGPTRDLPIAYCPLPIAPLPLLTTCRSAWAPAPAP